MRTPLPIADNRAHDKPAGAGRLIGRADDFFGERSEEFLLENEHRRDAGQHGRLEEGPIVADVAAAGPGEYALGDRRVHLLSEVVSGRFKGQRARVGLEIGRIAGGDDSEELLTSSTTSS